MSGSISTYTAIFAFPAGSRLVADGHGTGQPPGHGVPLAILGALPEIVTAFADKPVVFNLQDPSLGSTMTAPEIERANFALHVWRHLWEADFARQARGVQMAGTPSVPSKTYTLTATYLLPGDADLQVSGCNVANLITAASGTTVTFDVAQTAILVANGGVAAQEANAALHAAIHAIWLMQFVLWKNEITVVPYP